MTLFASYETRVSGHLLEVRDIQQRSVDTARAPMDGATARPNLITGIDSGPVRIEVGLFPASPPVATDGWEETAEVSVYVHSGGIVIVGIEDEASGMPPIGADEGGDYRLRIYARGRSLAYDAIVPTPVETYRIEAWPAPWSRPAVLATSSKGALPDLVQVPDSTGVRVIVANGGPDAGLAEDEMERMRRQHENLKRMSRRRPD